MGSSTSPVPQWEHEDPQPPNRDTGTLISVLGPPEPPQPYSGDPVVWGHDPLLISLPTGRGGASIYGKHFEDELHSELKFTGEISVPKPHLYVSKRKKKKNPKKTPIPSISPSVPPSIHPQVLASWPWPTQGRTPTAANSSSRWRRRSGWMANTPSLGACAKASGCWAGWAWWKPTRRTGRWMMSKCSKLSLLGDVGNKSVHGVVWWWCVGWEHRGVSCGAWRRHLWGHGNVTHRGVEVFPIHTHRGVTHRAWGFRV